MAYGKRLLYEEQRSLANGSIVAGYTAIGSGLSFPSRVIEIYNGTDALLQFSIDGIKDHFVLPPSAYRILDVAANNAGYDNAFFWGKGTVLYVKRIGTPTSGNVYFSSIYGRGD